MIRGSGGVRLGEVADAGSAAGHELMLLAHDIVSGEQAPDAARAEAAALIRRETSR